MTDKLAYVVNERGNLVPIMLTIETRDDTDYIMERELMFLTDLEFTCMEAESFAKGVAVGYAVKTHDDVKAIMGAEVGNAPRTEAQVLEDAMVGSDGA